MPKDPKPTVGAPLTGGALPPPNAALTIAQEAGLPDNWVPQDTAAPIVPGGPPTAPAMGPYFSGSIPANLQLQPDLVNTQYQSPNIPQVRLAPVGPAGIPSVSAAIQSIVDQTVGTFSLVMPKEYNVNVQGLKTVVTWKPEPAGFALMGPPATTTTVNLVPYFNDSNSQSGTGASFTAAFSLTLSGWAQNTAYPQGSLIIDSNNNVQRATTGGTSHNTNIPPVFATNVGGTVTDGTVVWTCVKYIITTGDLLVILVNINDPSTHGSSSGPFNTTSITDSLGDNWGHVTNFKTYTNSGGRNASIQVWTAVAASNVVYTAGTTLAVTINNNGISDTTTQLEMATYSNLAAFGAEVGSSGTGSTWSSGSLAISATEVLMTFTGSNATNTIGGAFTDIFSGVGANSGGMGYYFPNAAGSYSDSWSAGSSTSWASFLVAYQIGTSSTGSSGPGIPSFRGIVNTDLANAIFGPSGLNHNPGAVPDPGATAGTTRFLREDATWDVPSGGFGNTSTQVVDFGNLQTTVSLLEDTTAKVTVSDASVLSSTTFFSQITGGQDHPDSDEAAAEDLVVSVGNVVSGVSYDVTVYAPNGTWGKWAIFIGHD